MDTDHTDDPAAFTDYVAEVTRFTITHAHHLSEDILQKGFTLEERERKLQEDEQNLAYEQEQLDLEEKRLHAEIALLQEQKTEVEYINLRTRKHIHLNVGGTILETSVFTLTSVPGSMLEAMFSGRHPVKKDSHGNLFIDRDPTYFKFVLEYLRKGTVVLSPQKHDSLVYSCVMDELDYCCVPIKAQFQFDHALKVMDGNFGQAMDIIKTLDYTPATVIRMLEANQCKNVLRFDALLAQIQNDLPELHQKENNVFFSVSLGFYYFFKDPSRAVQYLKPAADKGCSLAQFGLGKLLLNLGQAGIGMGYLERSSANGFAFSMLAFAEELSTGENIPKDDKRAMSLRLQALEQGFKYSGRYIGRSYLEAKKFKKAVEFLKEAADAGCATACFELGIIYNNKNFGEHDQVAAVNYMTKAAGFGWEKAKRILKHWAFKIKAH